MDKNVHIWMDGELHDKAKKLADKKGWTFRAVVEHALKLLVDGPVAKKARPR